MFADFLYVIRMYTNAVPGSDQRVVGSHSLSYCHFAF